MPLMQLDEEGRPKLTFYERGPGPAGYKLPPLLGKKKHAVTHRINPEFTFGLQLPSSFLLSNIGPGAGAYMLESGVKAKGKFRAPVACLTSRSPPLKPKPYPGPNDYKIPPPEINRNKAPAFTLRIRPPLPSKLNTPGPNYLLLPRMIGPKIPDRIAAAECTLKGDRKSKLNKLSPGPIYDIGKPELVKNRAPGYTMRIKWADLTQSKYEAGPASYDPYLRTCTCPAGWKLGIRHNDFTGVFKTQCDKSRYEPLD